MLSKDVKDLVVEVFCRFRRGYREDCAVKDAEADPEAHLISLLMQFKKYADDVSAMTRSTIEKASYDASLKEARKFLERQSQKHKINSAKEDESFVEW